MDRHRFEQLLLHYPHAHSFDLCAEDDLNIFLLTATRWLFRGSETSSTTEDTTTILDRLHHATQAIITRGGRIYTAEAYSVDELLIRAIDEGAKALDAAARPQVLSLLHALETCYHRGYLTGDQRRIRSYLHGALLTAHESPRECDEAHCSWLGHTCNSEGWVWTRGPGDDCQFLPAQLSAASRHDIPQPHAGDSTAVLEESLDARRSSGPISRCISRLSRALRLRSASTAAADEDVAAGRSRYESKEKGDGPRSDGGRGNQPSKVVDVEGGVSIQHQ